MQFSGSSVAKPENPPDLAHRPASPSDRFSPGFSVCSQVADRDTKRLSVPNKRPLIQERWTLARRKKKSATSGKKRWIWLLILVLLAAAVAIGIALTVPLHLQAITPPPQKPAPVKAPTPRIEEKYLPLGSYGVMVQMPSGGEKALNIRPIAVLQGHEPWHSLTQPENLFNSLIANPFMAFPQLDQVAHSIAAQNILSQQIRDNIAPTLARLEPGWKIVRIDLHPALQAPPP